MESSNTTHSFFFLRSIIQALDVGIFTFLLTVFTALAQNPPEEGFIFRISPAATGSQLVRASLALPPGFLEAGQTVKVQTSDGSFQTAGLRVLERHPFSASTNSIRKALLTFPWTFLERRPVDFRLTTIAKKGENKLNAVKVQVEGESLAVEWQDGRRIILQLLAPSRTSQIAPRCETIEDNWHYNWQRFHFPDSAWPRMIESRVDSAGCVVILAHIQRLSGDGNFAPDLGWEFELPAKEALLKSGDTSARSTNELAQHAFNNGLNAECIFDNSLTVYHPTAPGRRRGEIKITASGKGNWTYRCSYYRQEDKIPMQPTSWRQIEIVLAPPSLAKLPPSLTSPHTLEIPSKNRISLHALPPELEAILKYHRDAITQSSAVGDDFGNVTGYNDGMEHGGIYGMNRLNHGAAIFEDGRRSNDRRLIETGLLWCNNFYDQSIWWGEKERGGTRYNNLAAMNKTPPSTSYMWRSDSSVNFCTKGYDCFQYAWEESGDPRMIEALHAQVAYAAKYLQANQGECRNIGDVRDFVQLYQITGEKSYLEEALRLFRELRSKLSTGNLFDQGGKPLTKNPPFIDEDERGLQVGYAKPYIIGYALAGLPELIRFTPDEPQLKETVQAVADFLASTVDPSGGWRYPHPRSSGVIVSQGIEHAWQLTQAVKALGPKQEWLNAIETVLRARILFWQRTRKIFSGLEGWEISTGKVKDRKELQKLYEHPEDRDSSRDYSEGRLSFGSSAPEGLVYFREVLDCYLMHRSVERLLAPPKSDEPLGLLLKRTPQ